MDDFLIDANHSSTGWVIAFHQVKLDAEPVVKPDRPWEKTCAKAYSGGVWQVRKLKAKHHENNKTTLGDIRASQYRSVRISLTNHGLVSHHTHAPRADHADARAVTPPRYAMLL